MLDTLRQRSDARERQAIRPQDCPMDFTAGSVPSSQRRSDFFGAPRREVRPYQPV
jgi:hypothetical protein